MTDAILWHRLDTVGHDACRLVKTDRGWKLEGMAVFRLDGIPACLAYEVACDDAWRSRYGVVRGWIGDSSVYFKVTRRANGIWMLNDEALPHLFGCIDLDLGFTPATNLFHLKRVALQIGQAADVPAAWLDVPAGILGQLHQRYERRTDSEYWYEAPRFDYFALLQVNTAGFVEKYPNLWEAVP